MSVNVIHNNTHVVLFFYANFFEILKATRVDTTDVAAHIAGVEK